MITIALSKGRIFTETMPILNKLGISCEEDPEVSRKLVFRNTIDSLINKKRRPSAHYCESF